MDDESRRAFTQVLVESLSEAQRRSGRQVQAISEDTVPFTDLEDFDSHSGVEVEVLLSERVGFEIEDIPFCEGRRGSRQLPVSEIVNVLVKKYGTAIQHAMKRSTEVTTTQ